MEVKTKQIDDALESFFKDEADEVVEYMESMLYDWCQHYAMDHYHIDHINNVVNAAFRVNDLLLKLNYAMQTKQSEKEYHSSCRAVL